MPYRTVEQRITDLFGPRPAFVDAVLADETSETYALVRELEERQRQQDRRRKPIPTVKQLTSGQPSRDTAKSKRAAKPKGNAASASRVRTAIRLVVRMRRLYRSALLASRAESRQTEDPPGSQKGAVQAGKMHGSPSSKPITASASRRAKGRPKISRSSARDQVAIAARTGRSRAGGAT